MYVFVMGQRTLKGLAVIKDAIITPLNQEFVVVTARRENLVVMKDVAISH